MGQLELSSNITEEQKAMQTAAKKFFMDVWRPASIELDKLSDPAEVIAKKSIFWDVLRDTYKHGWHNYMLPAEVGGQGTEGLTNGLMDEVRGYASIDFSIALGVDCFPFYAGVAFGLPDVTELAKEYCADTEGKMIGCWAITEPDHGTDWLIKGSDSYAKEFNPTPQLTVTKKGNDYVVNGQKSQWVSNGTIATHAYLFFGSKPGCGFEDCGVACMPLNVKGVTRGKPWNKLGQRALNQGEIFFDDAPLPAKYVMVVDNPELYYMTYESTLTTANQSMGNQFAGVAQAALDEALNAARTRTQGGAHLIRHDSIKTRLFDMFMEVEAAKYFARSVLVYNDPILRVFQPAGLHYAMASKVFATKTAFDVASQAIQIYGGLGLAKECFIEKLFRDARMGLIEDGANEGLAIGGGAHLLK